MRLQEIPALPFALDTESAAEWLDQLPVTNIRECCRLLFPVMQALNIYPMPPRLRFEIMEKCHPIVLGVSRDIHLYFQEKSGTLDAKARKIASLPARFHLEAAEGYRLLLENESSRDTFSATEYLSILQRALDHLGHNLLRTAQSYDPPSSSIDSSLNKLYRNAHACGLIDETGHPEHERQVSAQTLFARILLFRLAAPGRLTHNDMQRLFDRFLVSGLPNDAGREQEGGTGRSVFYYDPKDINVLVPAWSTSPPLPKLPFFSPEPLLAPFRTTVSVAGNLEQGPLIRALSRIGERLPCQDVRSGRRVTVCIGFDATIAMIREVEFRRRPGGTHLEPWSVSNHLELAPNEPAPGKFFGLHSLANALSETESSEGKRRIEIVPTDLPGFYLIDSESLTLRAGKLLGVNSDDQWIQVAVVRGGQIRDGRFWHSVELLGAEIRAVKASLETAPEDARHAFLLSQGTEEDPTLVVPPCKWPRDSLVSVSGLDRPREKRSYRITSQLEAAADFCQYRLDPMD